MLQQLLDSRSTLEDHLALRNRFASAGYLFIRSYLNKDDVDNARIAINEALSGHAIPDWNANLISGVDIDGSLIADSLQNFYRWPGFRAASQRPELHRLPYVAPLARLTRSLLGDHTYCIPWGHLRIAPPASQATMSGRHAHQDFNFWRVNDMITCWIPLMRVPVQLGGLAINPGSHLRGPSDDHILASDEEAFATADYEVGDIVLFHCLTEHAVLPNTCDELRMSGDFRWVRSNEAVRERLIHGPDGQRAKHHAELFERERFWQPVPPEARIVPHPQERRQPPASALFQVSVDWTR